MSCVGRQSSRALPVCVQMSGSPAHDAVRAAFISISLSAVNVVNSEGGSVDGVSVHAVSLHVSALFKLCIVQHLHAWSRFRQ